MKINKNKKRVTTPTVAPDGGGRMRSRRLGDNSRLPRIFRSLELVTRRVRSQPRRFPRAANVIKAARLHGMEGRGFKRNADTLLSGNNFPVIVFWRNSHFLVLEGSNDKLVYLNDPASGHRRVTHEEFKRDYSGIVLEFTPGPDFKKGGKPYSIFSGLKERMSGEKDGLWLIVGLSLLLVLPSLAIPVFSKIFVDKVSSGKTCGLGRTHAVRHAADSTHPRFSDLDTAVLHPKDADQNYFDRIFFLHVACA